MSDDLPRPTPQAGLPVRLEGSESESRLRFALEAVGIGDWDMDLRSGRTERSLLHDRCFGYTEAVPEWGYDTFLAHIHPLDRERVDRLYRAARDSGGTYDAEFRVVWPDGSVHWLWSKGQFFRDAQGELYRATGIQVDITARGEAEARREAELLHSLHQQAQARAAHEQLRDILERVDDGFIALDRRGDFTYLNTRGAQLLGRERPEDLLGRHIWTELPQDIGQLLQPAYEQATQTQQPVVLEKHFPPWDRWFENRIYPSEEGLSVYFTETTARKRAELLAQAQLARTELLNRITRAVGDRLDLDSVFRVVADTLQQQLPADFVAVALYEPGSAEVALRCVAAASQDRAVQAELVEGRRLPVQRNGLSRCVAGELVHEPELQGLDFVLPWHLLAAGLRSAVLAPLQVESTVFGLVIVARSAPGAFSSGECEFLRQLGEQVALAASQARLHQTLQHTYDELQRSQQAALQQERLRALGQMASGIAHDINNAIAPVALYTESLLDGEPGLSERARQYLQVIQRSIDDVAETVARMREFYRPQPTESRRAAVSLNTLVQQVLELTRARWRDMPQQSGIAIAVHTELAEDLPAVQAADGEIREALTNLVFNAVDALPQGGTVTLRTRVRATDSGQEVLLEVADDGLGMDEATRQRCLEPFFTTKGERGTGLGLAMVYGTLQRHGGRIEIDSQPGQGTTMRLALPTGTDPLPPPQAVLQPVRGLRVLLVDDDPQVLAALAEILRVDDHRVTPAQGGTAGIDAFNDALQQAQPFDVVVTDLGMPHVDGRQVAAAVKAARPATRVIMLTGWGRRMQQDDERPAHVDALLSKPPKLAELRQALAATD